MGTQGRVYTFPLRLPRTLRCQVEECAVSEGISINEFIMLAVGEKIVRPAKGNSNDGQSPDRKLTHELL